MGEFTLFAFGRFTLYRAEQEIAPPGRQGDTLCKALLCQPGRQAESAWLLEQLWPEAEGDLAATYLYNAAYTLRQTLPKGMLLTHKATQSYQLAGQDRLWVDADAALALMAEVEARGHTTAEALPLLEQAAQYFRRGRFLAGVEETWVQARRMHLETMKERALTWLVEAYRQGGKMAQAQTLLAEALAEDPTNENLLCHLMQTLHEDGMTHQALRAYDTFVKALRKVGLEPAEATTDLYERLKRAPRVLALPQAFQPPARQAKREPLPAAVEETENRTALISAGPSGQQTQPLLPFPDRVSRTAWASYNHHRMLDLLCTMPDTFPATQDLGAWLALGAGDLGALLEQGWSIDALLEVLQIILPVIKAMPMMTRRTFLQAGFASLLGGLPVFESKQISEEEIMQFCQAFNESINAGWKLFTLGKNTQALATSQAQFALLHHMTAALPVQERPALYASRPCVKEDPL